MQSRESPSARLRNLSPRSERAALLPDRRSMPWECSGCSLRRRILCLHESANRNGDFLHESEDGIAQNLHESEDSEFLGSVRRLMMVRIFDSRSCASPTWRSGARIFDSCGLGGGPCCRCRVLVKFIKLNFTKTYRGKLHHGR